MHGFLLPNSLSERGDVPSSNPRPLDTPVLRKFIGLDVALSLGGKSGGGSRLSRCSAGDHSPPVDEEAPSE